MTQNEITCQERLEATGYNHCVNERGTFQSFSLTIKELYKRGDTLGGQMMRDEAANIIITSTWLSYWGQPCRNHVHDITESQITCQNDLGLIMHKHSDYRWLLKLFFTLYCTSDALGRGNICLCIYKYLICVCCCFGDETEMDLAHHNICILPYIIHVYADMLLTPIHYVSNLVHIIWVSFVANIDHSKFWKYLNLYGPEMCGLCVLAVDLWTLQNCFSNLTVGSDLPHCHCPQAHCYHNQ